ncbi:MAG: 1-deoxy-D-xylulose-5-phosphate reductoisomerase, partial [Candidatus Electrothrix sp. AR1]|nr:1-deoxy-D-xylulose-5-phosphate reductoisomerase [Candidatus Electrothrix sp. AR1]
VFGVVVEEGGVKPAVLNAANEVAVAAFLDEQIGFTDITAIVASTLDCFAPGDDLDLDAVLAADTKAREIAGEDVAQRQLA